ncbi:MAG: hypothetical protein HY927_02100 [Elusimicrobia bacterium]|nr:hypothetical protein [Elusimicrobiota bacterium]
MIHSRVVLSPKPLPNCPDVLSHARATLRLAAALGVDTDSDLVSPAPLLSLLCGRRMFFLRGWRRYENCVKGFNALGLLAEHAGREERALSSFPKAALRRARLEFLASRRVFAEAELRALPAAELDRVDLLSLALWRAFSRRTIVCATSSNLGICLHQALADMRLKELSVAGRRVPLLDEHEGRLVIWCPDERADFMSPEKSALLKSLEAEAGGRTTLRTYINRRQRDPGALKEALERGGYFFPTNPQSRAELRSLLALALRDIEAERRVPLKKLLRDPGIRRTLESLGASAAGGRVSVRSPMEGGMLGMAAPYLAMLREARRRGDKAIAVWNPASIGAALASLALCDQALREAPIQGCPGLKGIRTRVHGVFDIANLQSLAQLFGVVVERHQSGRQTAYVGLGSSSYATGNLCFDILRANADANGAFRGRGHLHPATHALNPVAQALVYAEELIRAAGRAARAPGPPARKPEPAGAAALAGYLLARLDGGTLSSVELAYALRLGGFTRASFLEFGGFGRDQASAERFVEQAGEEGACMESLARGVLQALDWDWPRLRRTAAAERGRSRRKYSGRSLDDAGFEAQDPAVHLHLTGDYCTQPSPALAGEIRRSCEQSRPRLAAGLRPVSGV